MKAIQHPSIVAILVLFCMAGLVFSVHTVQAAREMQLYAGIDLQDNLLAFKGKSVTITLSSGKQMTGIVKDVKNNLLHLERLSLKDFYDALLRIDHISAIEARVRQE
jgi:small nuclear ribonucleoprotein (snRNP)-like protein